jgi:hypothetical protein
MFVRQRFQFLLATVPLITAALPDARRDIRLRSPLAENAHPVKRFVVG